MVSPWIEAELMGDIEIKGKLDPVPVFRVLGRKDIPSQARGITGISSPLVGRDQEFSIITNKIRNLFQGQGQIFNLGR